jgi:RNA polymerase sigma-70 factor, ECF subfamily
MSTDNGLSAFQIVRQRLFGIAYRMLGNAAEAEDIVQDVWLRWQLTDRDVVRDAGAFLATATTRLALNAMHSARARRETPAESWQTEPIDAGADPRVQAERGQELSQAMLSLLETLTHREQAAFILREAFDYPYRDIAGLLRLEVANARQLVTRARSRVAHRRTRDVRATERRPRLLDAFIAAARHGDIAGLEGFLAPPTS